MSKSRLIKLKVSYISQFLSKNLVFCMSTFVLNNSLQRTNILRTWCLQYSAVIFCAYMRFIAIFWSLALVDVFICHFVFQYYPQILDWIEILAVIRQSNVLIFFFFFFLSIFLIFFLRKPLKRVYMVTGSTILYS